MLLEAIGNRIGVLERYSWLLSKGWPGVGEGVGQGSKRAEILATNTKSLNLDNKVGDEKS